MALSLFSLASFSLAGAWRGPPRCVVMVLVMLMVGSRFPYSKGYYSAPVNEARFPAWYFEVPRQRWAVRLTNPPNKAADVVELGWCHGVGYVNEWFTDEWLP